TGNMLILSYAHAFLTNTTHLINAYYPTLLSWANELTTQTLYPVTQVSTDDFEGAEANYTNLALKGLCGIMAMGRMAGFAGRVEDKERFESIASNYSGLILENGLSADGTHFKVTYQSNDSSWISAYNLYPDVALSLDLFEPALYEKLGDFYATVAQPYGVPLDSRGTTTKTDWSIMTAAMHLDNPGTRDAFVHGVVNYVSSPFDFRPFPDRYDSVEGGVRALYPFGGDEF
ncbi:hypothetical protein P7C70_g4786, partial [Phenoliferia sp. Uapishka_3]